MKKLFISFLTTTLVTSFAFCDRKSDAKSTSTTEAKTETKVEPNDENISKSNSSSRSSIVRSSTRNQYVRKSHEQWIADSIFQMAPKLKDNQKYNNAFTKWIVTSDGKSTLSNLYYKSNNFMQELAKWKQGEGSNRDKDWFFNQIAKSKDTASYKIYKAWVESSEGKSEMKALYKQPSSFFNTKYTLWSNLRTKISYANRVESDEAFKDWRKSNDGREALKNLFKADSAEYDKKYLVWISNNIDKWKNNYIESKDRVSNGVYEKWLGTYKGFQLDQIPIQPNEPLKNAVKDWLKTSDAIAAVKKKFEMGAPSWANAFFIAFSTDAQFRGAILGPQSPILRPYLKEAFLEAIKSADNEQPRASKLAIAYYNWKKEKYIYKRNSAQSNNDPDLWVDGTKITATDPDVKNAFKAALGVSGSFENKQFSLWLKWNSTAHYELDSDFGKDIEVWAINRKNQVTPSTQNVQAKFIQAMELDDNNGNKQLKEKYLDWKTPSLDKYKTSKLYLIDFAEYLREGGKEDEVKTKISDIISLDSFVGGNQELKKAFIAWQLPSKENFIKSEKMSVNSDFNTWLSLQDEVDLTILFEISQILQDKDLFANQGGNSKFVESLKEITKDEYDAYILAL